MKKWLFLPLCILTVFGLSAQTSLNMNMLCNWDDDALPLRSNGAYSDIWGYSDAAGNEVAILGGIEDVIFINVNDCSFIDSFHILNTGTTNDNPSIWRDFKTYGQYAYGVADEGSSGLLIFDMSDVPNSVTKIDQTNAFFNEAHNIFIDEPNARLYVAGSPSRSNGLIVLDISNPTMPVEIDDPVLPGGYVHDVFVKDNIAWASHGTGGLRVYNFTNFSSTSAPVQMGAYDGYLEEGYNHSSWLDDTDTYLVFADESFGRSVKRVTVDINLTNNVVTFGDLELFKSHLSGSASSNSIAHNPFILGNNVYISYYHDGVQVYDISQPDTVTRVAYYDTYPESTTYSGFDGAWGVYPYLPSGKIIASDILNGMFSIEMFENPLPLEFIEFNLQSKDESINLSWAVEGYEDGASFEIIHSTDAGQKFNVLDIKKFDPHQQQYTFEHSKPAKNRIHYYQINVINQDGSKDSSPLKSIWLKGTDEIGLRSNQITDQMVLLNGPENVMANVDILNVSGQLVQSQKILLTGTETRIALDNLPSQMYFIKINSGEFQFSEKFWKGE